MLASLCTEIIAAEHQLAAIDSKHTESPYVLPSGNPKTLDESYPLTSLTLDAVRLTSKHDPTIVTTMVDNIVNFFDANVGSFPLYLSILQCIEDYASRVTSAWMPMAADDGFRRALFENTDVTAAYKPEISKLSTAITTKYQSVMD